MASQVVVACCIISLTLLGFFWFPGHTYLQSDTQIYVPMLEHIWDSSTFPNDLVATKPHLSYTLYDEAAIGLRWLTRSSFEAVLIAQQLVFRALQILGVYLLASAFPLSRVNALLVAAVSSLGAAIAGPAVLTIEYEPVPRGFAIGLVMLAIGLTAQRRLVLASMAGSLAFLYHAPTTVPFWIVFGWVVLTGKTFRALIPIGCAALILFVASRFQAGAVEQQAFFFRIDAEFESLQRFRASYNWVSTWIGALVWQYLFYWAAGLIAFWRVRPRAGGPFLLAMPLLGMCSVPLSYILLERGKWGFIPQFQPARALLFVTLFASVLGTAAAVKAVAGHKLTESFLWLAVVFAIPMQARIENLLRPQIALLAGLAIVVTACLNFQKRVWAVGLLAAALVSAYVLPPSFGRVSNYARIEDPEVGQLCRYLEQNTPKDAMLLFADAGKGLYPGVVRARSLRSVYVDWKAGGQVNYYRSLGEEWWSRWRRTNRLEFQREAFDRFSDLGVDYVVLANTHRVPERDPEYQNGRFVVYRMKVNTRK